MLYWSELSKAKMVGIDLIRETKEKVASDCQELYVDLEIKYIEFAEKVLHFGMKGKLSTRFIGSYEIIEKVGHVAYRLTLPPELEKIHNRHCVSLVEYISIGGSKRTVRKKYISQRFIDQKRIEFLELKQGRMFVTEYEREFVRLSRYARECVSTEAIMCKRFEDGLNEDINLLVGILEIKEFVIIVQQALPLVKTLWHRYGAEEATGETKESMKLQYSNLFLVSFESY
ncbi:Gag-Pol polyprotein [Gossypium australe]|uniref:Gag-Pol polyprotein n=1 Tax=Gossypium australe TaxID=47621 RepID=A0A5B6WTT0_9ROSI|nr:Gag-Pol polyprotein [Gossypium australe]